MKRLYALAVYVMVVGMLMVGLGTWVVAKPWVILPILVPFFLLAVWAMLGIKTK